MSCLNCRAGVFPVGLGYMARCVVKGDVHEVQLLKRGEEPLPRVRRYSLNTQGDCKYPGCTGSARARGLCWGHYKQDLRGQKLTPLFKSPFRPRRR